MQLKELLQHIETFAPLSLQEEYDNAGLICGNPENEISTVLLTTDITEPVIDEAVEKGCNLIISHHPLTLKGIKNLRPDSYVQRCLIKAIQHNINLYSAHTNMDAVKEGVSGRMAKKLGLTHCQILQPVNQQGGAEQQEFGFGIIGDLPEPVDTLEFLNHVKEKFHCKTIRHTAISTPLIKRVALCGGAGSFLTQVAIASGADIYITADFKYHDFFQAENKIIIADIGHYESEQFTKEIFYELLTKKLPTFAIQFSRVQTNPVYYL